MRPQHICDHCWQPNGRVVRRRAEPNSPLCNLCQRWCARGPKRLGAPSSTLAASAARVAVYVKRRAENCALWHPLDNQAVNPDRVWRSAHDDDIAHHGIGVTKKGKKFLARVGSGTSKGRVSLGCYRTLDDAVLSIRAYKRWREIYLKA